ncbi:type II toxin-antitoxin system VapC family toxin [Candidatus Electronema sp. PJ]|uniref:type II toxin-antitoxin system VapC family toxin n=1 Tax=Candidatus Electronema sp. PJ TaxID=3401572 RepID=UPI003AA814BC
MILIDTCGWIEWLTDGPLCAQFEPYFNRIESVIVPTSVQFELYKWTARRCNLQTALEVAAVTEQGSVAPLSTAIALSAADFSAEHSLSFADSIIYATARFHNALLITSDAHFEGLPGVKFFRKQQG